MPERLLRIVLLCLGLVGPGTAWACSKVVFPYIEFGSPLIVDATVVSVTKGVAEVTIHDTLRAPSEPLVLPLQVMIDTVGYGASCETRIGEAMLVPGDRAFLMLVPNELDDRAPWRPHGYWETGLRRIVGDATPEGTLDAFREQVRLGPAALMERAEQARQSTMQAACDAGDGAQCRLLARDFGLSTPKRATSLLRSGCRLRDEEACLQLGLLLIGDKVDDDYDSVPDRVADVAYNIEAACAAGDATACDVRARAVDKGRTSAR